MKRIYFLVPTIELAKTIVDELLLARIEERHIHILAKRGTPLENLPEALVATVPPNWQLHSVGSGG